MPKSCRDLVTYLARYPATRRGDNRDAVMRAVSLASGSVAAMVVSGVNGWVSIWVPNRSVRTALLVGAAVAGGYVDADVAGGVLD